MLRLGRTAYDALLEHAREDTPSEACGLLVGSQDQDVSVVHRIERMENVATTPEITYEIDPEAQYRAMATVEDEDLSVLGFYHSHPRGPEGPSTTDHAKATWTGYHYLIVSLGGRFPVVDAWVWTGERFARDAITIAPGSGQGRD